MSDEPVRLNKYLAHEGIASRREADALIAAGKVFVNGEKAELGTKVTSADEVTLTGTQKTKKYLAYYKGRGVITHSPGENETDIMEKLAADYGITDVNPIGRLDKDSEGLILLSTDGRITGPLLDPEANHEKEYDVTVDKPINQWFLRHMAEGVDIEGYQTKPTAITANEKNRKRFRLILTEGKKHQIRRMCAALGYQVQDLKRVRIVNIELGDLKPNQFRNIKGGELAKLLHSLAIKK
ncbi:MAG: pseudouridine synthase [Patescibacteria group bacterium]